jgi:hypothetical protein
MLATLAFMFEKLPCLMNAIFAAGTKELSEKDHIGRYENEVGAKVGVVCTDRKMHKVIPPSDAWKHAFKEDVIFTTGASVNYRRQFRLLSAFEVARERLNNLGAIMR